MKHILVIRLSAIGDVAMTIPVIYSAARSNPSARFTVLTQAFLIPLFMNRPTNVELIGINTQTTERQLPGLLRFLSALSRYDFDTVLDLHDVLRTKLIRWAFRIEGKRVFTVDKGRNERAKLTAEHDKRLVPLRPMTERYADVFRKAGLAYEERFTSLYEQTAPNLAPLLSFTGEKRGQWIGIAPFAKHQGKIYPIDEMENIVERLAQHEDYTLFLFGGGGYEEAVLDQWAYAHPHTLNVAGRFSLDKELALMGQLDLLICMDSANMHFGSLVGTRVLSIWGATHPYAGFYGYRQRPEDCVQLDMPCRPCSVYGQKPCARGDWACMRGISPEMVIKKVEEICSGS